MMGWESPNITVTQGMQFQITGQYFHIIPKVGLLENGVVAIPTSDSGVGILC